MKRVAVVLPGVLVLAAALARPKIEFPVAPEISTVRGTDVCGGGILLKRATRTRRASSEPPAEASTSTRMLYLDERFHRAFQAFNTQWYFSAGRLCREVLEAAPGDPRALDMLARIPAAKLDRLLYLKHSRGRLQMDPEVLNDLTPDEWDEIVPRLVAEALHPTGEGYPSVAAVHWALDTLKIDFAFDRWSLDAILNYIRDYSGLNLLVSAAVQERVALDEPLTLHLSDLPLREALRLLAQQVDPRLGIVVTDEKIVLISEPHRLSE
jgi:hypothetical protein